MALPEDKTAGGSLFRNSPLWGVCLVAVLGGFLFGYDTAVINGAIQFLKAHFSLNETQEGLGGASAILGCIPGAMFAGFLSDRFGRCRVLFLCALLFAGSGVLSALPRTFDQFLAARFLSGLGIGASSMICPVYIAEIAPKEWRGRLGSLFQLGIVVGIFLTLFVNARIESLGNLAWNESTGWRWMFGAEAVPAGFLFFTLLAVPESPRWLLQAQRAPEALAILEKITGAGRARAELALMQGGIREGEGRWTDLLTARYRRPLLIAVALMAFSQFSGINAIIYYSTKIFTTAGIGVKNSFTASVIVGLVNLLFTGVAILLVDKAGRRPLLMIGLACQVVALGTVGVLFHLGNYPVALIVAILAFIAAFAMALGPIPWILCSEIFPTPMRGRAMSVATFTIWSSCYVVAQTFPMLNDNPAIGPALTFWIYAGFSLAGFLFVWQRIPETKGRSLEEIEQSWLLPEEEAAAHVPGAPTI